MVVAETEAQALDAAEAVDGRLRGAALRRSMPRRRWRPARPPCGTRCRTISLVETFFGDGAATERGFRRRRSRRHARLPCRPRHRGRARAARGARRLRAATRRFTLHAGNGGAVRQKRELATVLGIAPEKLRVVTCDVGGNFGSKNRPYVEYGLVLWAARKLGRPGQISRRRARRRSSPIIRAAISSSQVELALARRRARFWRSARAQHQQCRRALRVAVAARQGLGAHHRLLCHPGGASARPRRLHQHHADPGLSQLRPARK